MRPAQSTLISPWHSPCTLLKVSGQIASEVRHFSKRISQSLWVSRRCESFTCRRKSNHVSGLWRFSEPRQKMPSCPMHLADTMKFRSYLAVRSVTACVSTSCISASSGKWTTWCGRFRSSRNEFVARERVCENTRCPLERSARRIVRALPPPLSPRDKTASRGNRFLSRKTSPPFPGPAGKCSFRDIDADRNNFAGDSDFSSNARMRRDSRALRLRPFHKLQRYFRARFPRG